MTWALLTLFKNLPICWIKDYDLKSLKDLVFLCLGSNKDIISLCSANVMQNSYQGLYFAIKMQIESIISWIRILQKHIIFFLPALPQDF